MRDESQKVSKCSICGNVYTGYGNNAEPINDGRCCDTCNGLVIEQRMHNMRRSLRRDYRSDNSDA